MPKSIDLLPRGADIDLWTPEQKSVAEFVGFTAKVDGRTVVAPLGVRAAFLATVERTGLDPVQRQIYLLFIGGRWVIHVAIDGLRLVAERSGKYLGQTHPQWTDGTLHEIYEPVIDPDGKVVLNPVTGELVLRKTMDYVWRDVWVPTKDHPNPFAARVGVHKRGEVEPTYGIATWQAYGKTSNRWKDDGPNMLAKCAEALGLRRAHPMETSGLYTPEEMDADGELVSTGRDWKAELEGTATSDEVRKLYDELSATDEWNKVLEAEFRTRLSTLLAEEQKRVEEEAAVDA